MSDNKFPTYSNKRKIGDKGVTLVKSIVETQFDWIFRPTHLEDDFGIDGYFDVIGVDDSVTGKYLGVQIKTGESYFKNETSVGWKYTGEIKHLNYFLNSNFPILIIIVSLNLQKVYWVEFDVNKTERTNNGWSITIPKVNLLDSSSKSQIQRLTGEVIDYMPQIEYQWELNKQIKESSVVILSVSKEEILAQDITGFTHLLERLTVNDDMIKMTKGKISFVIDGFNNDEREVYEIPEIREWVKKVFPSFKYWGYFLNMETYMQKLSGLKILHFCSVDLKILDSDKILKRKYVEFDKKQTIKLMEQLFVWLNEFTDKHQISIEINKEQSSLILNVLFGIELKE